MQQQIQKFRLAKTVIIKMNEHANLDSFPLRYGFTFDKDTELEIHCDPSTLRPDKNPKYKDRYNIVAKFVNPSNNMPETGIFYLINNQDTILSIVNRAGGYLPSAYTIGSALFTEKAKKIQTENNDRLYKELIKFLVSSGTSSNAQQSSGLASTLPMLIADIKDIKPLGRVYAEFDILELQDDPNSNTYLNDGDKIVIPKFDNSIYIYGEVMNPGALAYKSGKTTNEYVANSGGYSKFAEIEYAVIIFPNGSAEVVNSSSGILKKLSGNSIDIYPGSVIYIPREMGAVRGINYASTFAPIISSLALSIASVVAIQDR